MINFKPLRGLVLIDREMSDEIQGGIVIPETSRCYGWRAKVVNIGEKVTNVKSGDQILYIREFTRLPFRERNMALTNAENIVAKIVVDNDVERIIPLNGYVMIEPMTEPNDIFRLIQQFGDNKSPSGVIFRVGEKCDIADTFIGHRCWYPPNKAIKCVEDDKHYILLQEPEILCVEN